MVLFFKEFVIYLIYFIEQFAITFLFVRRSERRKSFGKRLALTIVAGVAVQLIIAALGLIESSGAFALTAVFGIIKFTLSASPLLLLMTCYKIELRMTLFYMLLAAATRQWSSTLLSLVVMSNEFEFFVQRLLGIASFVIISIPVYFIIIRPFAKVYAADVDWLSLLLTMIVFVFCENLSHFILQMYGGKAVEIALDVIKIVFETFIFWTCLYFGKKSRQRSELAISNALLAKERLQFEALKRSAEAMQAQLHDVKYLLRSVKSDGATDEALAPMAELTRRLDASYNTGNETLDVILSDAAARFAERNIAFTCMVSNVAALEIMEKFDLYSLLGNAFDNAEEYLSTVEAEKRYVDCIVKTVNGRFLFIEIKNYYEGDGCVYVGMQSSKSDKRLHGFGVKNMKRIAEKYGGDLNVQAADGEFSVGATIPLPAK